MKTREISFHPRAAERTQLSMGPVKVSSLEDRQFLARGVCEFIRIAIFNDDHQYLDACEMGSGKIYRKSDRRL